MAPSSPRRDGEAQASGGSSEARGKEHPSPRSFDGKTRSACWQKAAVVMGRHPERWRQDAAGNVVCRRFLSCYGCLCYEYDHIVPFSKGGESTVDNCQILQTRVNRFKSDKTLIEQAEMQGFSCDIKFTERELDVIEMAVYGDVIRPGKQCRCRTVAEMLGQVKSKNHMAACELPYNDASENK
uniref:HNH nuclease domain-containing protein n=1 Tax=Leersia perrieri TaxID=77586 RepID=A0A0D9XIP2_9ORYZ